MSITGSEAIACFEAGEHGLHMLTVELSGSLVFVQIPEVKAKLEKSRFGTQGRTCNFKIIWGDGVGIMDDESLFEAIKVSDKLKDERGPEEDTIRFSNLWTTT